MSVDLVGTVITSDDLGKSKLLGLPVFSDDDLKLLGMTPVSINARLICSGLPPLADLITLLQTKPEIKDPLVTLLDYELAIAYKSLEDPNLREISDGYVTTKFAVNKHKGLIRAYTNKISKMASQIKLLIDPNAVKSAPTTIGLTVSKPVDTRDGVCVENTLRLS